MSLIALLFIGLRPLLAKKYSAKWIYYGWLLIIIGLIIPFRANINMDWIKLPSKVAEYTPVVYSKLTASTSAVYSEVNSGTNIMFQAPSTFSNIFSIQWYQIIGFIWLAGVISLSFYHVYRHYGFIKRANRWSENIESEQILNLLKQLQKDMNIKQKIAIKTCSGIPSPMMVGFINPTILLPIIELSFEQMSFILRHELIHYKRKDLLYKALVLIAVIIHWFNPVVYLIAKAISIQCEISCDEEVIKKSDIHGRTLYAETIIQSIRKQIKVQTSLSTNFYGGKEGMKNRIISIMDIKKKKAGVGILLCIIISIFTTGAVFATNINLPKQKEKQNEEIQVKSIKDYAIYEKYGLTYNEEKDMLFYNGEAVNFFVDQKDKEGKNYTLVTKSGTVGIGVKAVRNGKNELTGIRLMSEEEYDVNAPFKYVNPNNNNNNNNNKSSDLRTQNKKEKIKDEYSIYEKYGLIYNKEKDMLFYNGESVKLFIDEKDKGASFFVTRPNGSISIKASRNQDAELIGIALMSDEEYHKLIND